MRRGRTRGAGTLFLFLLIGVIVGSLVGNILAKYFDSDVFRETIEIGTQGNPSWIDLSFVRFTFGLTFVINFGTVLGILIGILFYFRS